MAVTIEKIRCRRWSDQVEELWLIKYYGKPMLQAQTEARALDITKDTFPDDHIVIMHGTQGTS